jgi:hypothetical protein
MARIPPELKKWRQLIQALPLLRYAGNFWFRYNFKTTGNIIKSEISACLSKLFDQDNNKAYLN